MGPHHLAVDALTLNRVQLRIMTSLLTGNGCLREYLHRIGSSRDELIYRLRNQDEKAYHFVFESAALEQLRQWRDGHWWDQLIYLLKGLPKRNFTTKLVKETSMFM